MKAKLRSLIMRRIMFVLFLLTLLFLIISVFSQQSSNISESVSNMRKNNFRVAKYDSLFWTPSDITVIFKKEPISHRDQNILSRVQIEENPIHSKLLPASSVGTKKSRAIESFERKHSGNNVVITSLDMLTSYIGFGQNRNFSFMISFRWRI